MIHKDQADAATDPATVARQYVRAGLSVIPIRTNGTKAPACRQWKSYQQRIATPDEIDQLFASHVGVAIVGGAVSGNLEIIDIDEPELVAPFVEAVEELQPGLIDRLTRIKTPRVGGGCHLFYRCQEVDIPGNMVLSQSEPRPQFNKVDGKPIIDPATGKQRHAPETLIETRGEGGYVVAPGSPVDCHHSGRAYQHIAGPPLSAIAAITADERDALLKTARSFNRYVAAADVVNGTGGDGGRAIDSMRRLHGTRFSRRRTGYRSGPTATSVIGDDRERIAAGRRRRD